MELALHKIYFDIIFPRTCCLVGLVLCVEVNLETKENKMMNDTNAQTHEPEQCQQAFLKNSPCNLGGKYLQVNSSY